ncbi:hypothetical protein NUACC26_006110 [Scytonema sp. NUACC26]
MFLRSSPLASRADFSKFFSNSVEHDFVEVVDKINIICVVHRQSIRTENMDALASIFCLRNLERKLRIQQESKTETVV